MDPDDTFDELAPAILRPARPRLAEARAAVAGLAQGRAAWEVLETRGVIAPALQHDEARVFGEFVPCPACGGGGSGDRGGPCLTCSRACIVLGPVDSAPRSVAAALAVASLDPAAVRTAEALARECAAALAPWGAPPFARVCWCAIAPAWWRRRKSAWMEPGRAAAEACKPAAVDADARVRAFERLLDARPDAEAPALSEAAADVGDAIWWRAAARAGLRVPADRFDPQRVVRPTGAAFAELVDPFAPVCGIWALGCALDGLERDGTAVLVVPAAA